MKSAARRAMERAVRESFGCLVAFLSARSRDIAAAEDALADAFAKARERWRSDGVPANPNAWLLTAARRRLLDSYRHARVESQSDDRLRLAQEEAEAMAEGGESGNPTSPSRRAMLPGISPQLHWRPVGGGQGV